MNIAMNEDFRIAYKYSDEVFANIRIPRDGLVDVNDVLKYIRSSYFLELFVYSRSFAGIGSPAGPCDTCGAMARLNFNDGNDRNAAIVLNSGYRLFKVEDPFFRTMSEMVMGSSFLHSVLLSSAADVILPSTWDNSKLDMGEKMENI